MKELESVVASLEDNRFDVSYAEDLVAAKEILLNTISVGSVVGVGDSVSVRQVIDLKELQDKGRVLINPFSKTISELTTEGEITGKQRKKMHRKAIDCDYFLTGTNALTEDGRLINTDGGGNRVAGMIFGPNRVIAVIGRNKIVKDLDEAFFRIRNVIAPIHAKVKDRNTPCVETGYCVDCDSEERICNVTTILDQRPGLTDFTVILVNEDLGLGWDEDWSDERIEKIYSNYASLTWLKSLPG